MKKQHFVFDLDDTLTDSYSHNQQLFVDTFKLYPVIFDEQVVRDFHYCSKGRGMEIQFQELITQFGLDLNAQEMVLRNHELHIQNLHKIKFLNEAVTFIKALKQEGRQLSIISGRAKENLEALLARESLTELFDNVVSCFNTPYEKPDPYALIQLMAKYNFPKDAYIYLGDSETDFQFAKNAGVDAMIIEHYANRQDFYRVLGETFLGK